MISLFFQLSAHRAVFGGLWLSLGARADDAGKDADAYRPAEGLEEHGDVLRCVAHLI
jgi:hypothetical protein